MARLRTDLAPAPRVERVRAGSEAELTEFALSVLDRAQEPGFAAALREGRLRFVPETPPAALVPSHVTPVSRPAPPVPPAPPVTLVTTMPAPVPELRKGLVTERDIAAVAEGETRLRVAKAARITPLAGDEARRRGIRIERTLA
ncbi:MAG: hypothetical protein V9G18_09430 [Albidovulum sp.]